MGDGSRRCWVKLTGIYRMSTAPGFEDVLPMARALIEAAPDRLIWVVVGDRQKIEAGIRELNLGEIHLIDADGNPIQAPATP